jgi:hypothetical protein
MSAPAKLCAFAAVLVVVFGGATLAGGAVGPVHDRADPAATKPADGMGMEGGGHGDSAGPTARAVRGLAVSESGLTLDLQRTTATPGKRFDLAFRILDREGRTVRDFDVEHTKRMHFIVVRRDMTGFQHVHPTQRADGLRVSLSEGASHAGEESELGFAVTRKGRPVAVADYLGAKGHLVALRQGDLAFLHVHPDESTLKFMATFPTAGRYRLFLQFKTEDGRIHTAAFTQEVSR